METFVSTARYAAPDQPHHNQSTLPPLPPVDPVISGCSLVLSNDGDHWAGTFGVVVAALLADLVLEGAVEASITWRDETDEVVHTSGWVVGYDPDNQWLDMADGCVVHLHSVLAIGI